MLRGRVGDGREKKSFSKNKQGGHLRELGNPDLL